MKLKDINNLKRINIVNIRLGRTIYEYELILDYIKDAIETINLYFNKYDISLLNFIDHTILNIEEFISNIINKENNTNNSNKLIKELYDLEKLNLIKLIITKKNKVCILNIAQTDNISITNRESLILNEDISFFEIKIAFNTFFIYYHDNETCQKHVDNINNKNIENLISIYNIIEDNIKRLKIGKRYIYKILKDSNVVKIDKKNRDKIIKSILNHKFDPDKLIVKKLNKIQSNNCDSNNSEESDNYYNDLKIGESDNCNLDKCNLDESDSCKLNVSDNCKLNVSDNCKLDVCKLDVSDNCNLDVSDNCNLDVSDNCNLNESNNCDINDTTKKYYFDSDTPNDYINDINKNIFIPNSNNNKNLDKFDDYVILKSPKEKKNNHENNNIDKNSKISNSCCNTLSEKSSYKNYSKSYKDYLKSYNDYSEKKSSCKDYTKSYNYYSEKSSCKDDSKSYNDYLRSYNDYSEKSSCKDYSNSHDINSSYSENSSYIEYSKSHNDTNYSDYSKCSNHDKVNFKITNNSYSKNSFDYSEISDYDSNNYSNNYISSDVSNLSENNKSLKILSDHKFLKLNPDKKLLINPVILLINKKFKKSIF